VFSVRISSSGTRRSRLSLAGVALGLVTVASACGASPGTEEEFAELLMREGTISQSQAECIADAVFQEYGDDDAVLTRLSFDDFETLTSGEDPIEGFEAFYDEAVQSCL
jgi:hypothetical protein